MYIYICTHFFVCVFIQLLDCLGSGFENTKAVEILKMVLHGCCIHSFHCLNRDLQGLIEVKEGSKKGPCCCTSSYKPLEPRQGEPRQSNKP